MTIYNPNLETQKGFFLRVPKGLEKVSVCIVSDQVKPGKDIGMRGLRFVKTESFCIKPMENIDGSDFDKMCDVFVDLEIEGLQFAHIIVTRHDPSDNGFLGEN